MNACDDSLRLHEPNANGIRLVVATATDVNVIAARKKILPASVPMPMLLLPVVLWKSAPVPMAVLLLPVLLK